MAATLTASACGGGDTPSGVTGPAIVITRVDVTAPATTLAPAQSVPLSAVARTASGDVVVNSAFTWSTSAANVATVSATGTVVAVAPGSALITASTAGVSGSVSITVTPATSSIASLVVQLDETTVPLGSILQATVTARDAANAPVPLGNRTVTWSTSNASRATVNQAGVVSAVGVGAVNVIVTVEDQPTARTATAALTVQSIPNAPASADVYMLPTQFQPFQTVVRQGGTVRFQFPSLAHNVIWDPRLSGSPADIQSTSNAVVTRNFAVAGVFKFKCTLHPGMDGEIIVSP